MRNIQKNKKSLFKAFVVAVIFAVSVLNLSVDFRRGPTGDISFVTLSSTAVKADDAEGSNNGYKCRCHTDNYNCRDGSWLSFRPSCDCMYLNGNACYNN